MSTYDSIPRGQVAASLGSGVGVREVISWQVSRSLSGGGLPQQARAVSGSSVGSGSVTLVPDSPGESPWSARATVPGEAVSIDAAADVGAPLSPVARMVSRDASADGWLSPVRTLSIEDEVPRGAVTIPEDVGRAALDACCVIDAAARAAGYSATPPVRAGCNYSLPLVGSLLAEIGHAPAAPTISDGARYAEMAGVAALTDSSVTLPPLDWAEDSAVLFACQVDAGSVILTDPNVGALLTITPTSVSVGTGAPVAVDMSGAPRAVALYTNSIISAGFVFVDGTSVAAATYSPAPPSELTLTLAATPGAKVGAVQIYSTGVTVLPDAPDSSWLNTRNALIAPANSPLDAIAEPTSGDAWDVIQQVAAATLGAAWIDEEGRLVYRNRDQLRGGEPQYTIQALDHLEDVPWSISTDEVADRVEFTYRPPTVSISPDYALTVYDTDETIRVSAGQTVTLTRDLDGAAANLAPWLRIEDTGTYPASQRSRYAAWTAPPGESGSAPAADALDVTADLLSPTRVRIRIRNTTSAPLWVYQLTLRARIHVQPGADITIARGLPETKAQRPLQVNAGAWVQDDTTAHQIADWLESQTAMPLPTIPPVRVIPDPSRRLGDVVRVKVDSIGGHEPVVFKALITSIDNSQTADGLEQRLGLTILAVTFDDWQRWGQARGITTFDQLQSALSQLTTFDALDHWLTDLGGDL